MRHAAYQQNQAFLRPGIFFNENLPGREDLGIHFAIKMRRQWNKVMQGCESRASRKPTQGGGFDPQFHVAQQLYWSGRC
jgi:hypothetical protein